MTADLVNHSANMKKPNVKPRGRPLKREKRKSGSRRRSFPSGGFGVLGRLRQGVEVASLGMIRNVFTCHALMENRNGLVGNAYVTQASGTCEREAAVEMIEEVPRGHRITVGADKGCDTKTFVPGHRRLPPAAIFIGPSRIEAPAHRAHRLICSKRERIQKPCN